MYVRRHICSPDYTRYRSLSPGLLTIQPRRGWKWQRYNSFMAVGRGVIPILAATDENHGEFPAVKDEN